MNAATDYVQIYKDLSEKFRRQAWTAPDHSYLNIFDFAYEIVNKKPNVIERLALEYIYGGTVLNSHYTDLLRHSIDNGRGLRKGSINVYQEPNFDFNPISPLTMDKITAININYVISNPDPNISNAIIMINRQQGKSWLSAMIMAYEIYKGVIYKEMIYSPKKEELIDALSKDLVGGVGAFLYICPTNEQCKFFKNFWNKFIEQSSYLQYKIKQNMIEIKFEGPSIIRRMSGLRFRSAFIDDADEFIQDKDDLFETIRIHSSKTFLTMSKGVCHGIYKGATGKNFKYFETR